MKSSIVFLVLLMSSAAWACPGSSYEFHNVSLTSKGAVSRNLESPEHREARTYDVIQLTPKDKLLLDALPGAQDVALQIQVKLLEAQKRSAKYEVAEVETGWGSPKQVIQRKVITVIAPPEGARGGCGEVKVEDIGTEKRN